MALTCAIVICKFLVCLLWFRGIGVKLLELNDACYMPSFDEAASLFDESRFYLQNLPSIVCAKVLDPQIDEYILDMCACPGGKTTHIAALVNNKVSSKIKF